jgi:hypothetical protein
LLAVLRDQATDDGYAPTANETFHDLLDTLATLADKVPQHDYEVLLNAAALLLRAETRAKWPAPLVLDLDKETTQ